MTAVTISVPAKLLLFGEYSILHGAPALLCALSPQLSLCSTKSACAGDEALTLDISSLSDREWGQLLLKFEAYRGKLAQVSSLPHKEEMNWAAGIASQTWEGLAAESAPKGQYKLAFKRDWPLSQGLGSSSGLYLLLKQFHALLMGHNELPPIASLRSGLRQQQGGGSAAELAPQLYGGMQYLEQQDSDPEAFTSLELPERFALLHSGRKWKSADCLKKFTPTKDWVARSAANLEALLSGNRSWVEAVRTQFELQKELGIVDEESLRIEEHLKAKGWTEAFKSSGAGGGDALFLILKSPSALQEAEAWARACGYGWSQYSVAEKGLQIHTD